jgi:hypothetical protein
MSLLEEKQKKEDEKYIRVKIKNKIRNML